jgi:hypothetical protein
VTRIQRRAETDVDERDRLQDEVWNRIRALPSVSDMLREVSEKERDACRKEVKAAVAADAARLDKPSWGRYEAAESEALEHMSAATLQHGQRESVGTAAHPG